MRDAGFDSFFTGTLEEKDFLRVCRAAEKVGIVYESIHAPFRGMNRIWEDGEAGEIWVPTLKAVVDRCREYGIGYFTLHCMNVPQFNPVDPGLQKWTETGLQRFTAVVEYAAQNGVRAAFENVEFPQYEMTELMRYLRKKVPEGLGFTWDVGHEHCYPGGIDVVDAFGDLMVGTHLHDNEGQKDPAVITWNDDCHIAPMEGTIDWAQVAARLRKVGYKGTLTIEMGKAPREALRKTEFPTDCDILEYLSFLHDRIASIAEL